jgi:hypothetical protein
LTAGRIRCVNKRDAYRLRSDEIHAVAAALGAATVPLRRLAVTEATYVP